MTKTRGATSFGFDQGLRQQPLGVYGTAVGAACGFSAAVLVVAAAFSVGEGGAITAVLAVFAGLCASVAAAALRRPLNARGLRAVPTLSAVALCYLVVAAISTAVYLVTGAIDRIEDALYESTAGVATSSLTLFEDPQVLNRGLLVWRSGTQWIGGLIALGTTIGISPFLGGSRELADPRGRGRRSLALADRPIPALRRVVAMYCAVTLVVGVALWVAGMSLLDAVAHTFSSVSTGGFSTHSASIAHFDSLAIELVLIVVMAGAGFSLALAWMIARGQFQDTLRTYELKVYAAVLVTGSVWVWAIAGDSAGSGGERVVDSVFTVVSLSTTTGNSVADWGSWHPGAISVLLLLLFVGGMAGSVAGGLRWIRVIGLVQFVWREMLRQLHPRAVRSVKVGNAPISEASIDRWYAQLVLTLVIGAGGACALALFGSGLVEALTLALSAMSATGAGLGDDGQTITTAAELSRWERASLMPMMLAGRVALIPALVAAAAVFFGVQRRVSSQLYRLRHR